MNDDAAPREAGHDLDPGWPDDGWPDLDDASLTWPDTAPGPARRRRGLAAPLALPAGFAALLVTGAIAAATHGALSAGWVLGLAAVIAAVAAGVSEPPVAPVLGLIGWLTVLGFSRAPYAQLQFAGRTPLVAALVVGGATLAGLAGGLLLRRLAAGFTLWIVDVSGESRPGQDGMPGPAGPARAEPSTDTMAALDRAGPDSTGTGDTEPVPAVRQRGAGRGWRGDLAGGISRRRLLAAAALLAGGLPLLTVVLSLGRLHPLGDDLLVYLVAVVAVAVVGGFWPAVLAAVLASLLVNWFFTPPVHTLTIGDGESLLALLLFVTVAVTVSSVVHLAAHRARQAARSTAEAQELLSLAQTVLGGADRPQAVLDHLTSAHGGRAELLERAGAQWVRVAASGAGGTDTARASRVPVSVTTGVQRARARAGLVLVADGPTRTLTERLLHGYAAQAAAALDRDRLRTQAAQAEALAEGNRMRTALLAAVSHDLRTPLASIKASVSTLRQTDVAWTPDDEAALLATIERSSDRLDALIGNLLDMSRLTAGSLEPFLRPTAIDEVAPVALRGLDAGSRMQLTVPDDLPLVRTDPGLLERVLANLFANALAYSPPQRDPELHARQSGEGVLLEIIDHGRGVPDELKKQMFEPFWRLDGHSGPGSVTSGGVGLGLAVVRGFLDIMGGSVTAADTPRGGLTMRVLLPAAGDPAEARSPQPQEER
jgi:K+-sensing histidine kinase KdpD